MKKIFSSLLSAVALFGACFFSCGVHASGNAAEQAAAAARVAATENAGTRDVELVFIMDKSGSMWPTRESTIRNFNRVIEEQKRMLGRGALFVTTVMFNDRSTKVHDRVNIDHIRPITSADYDPSGCTALRDTVVETLKDLSLRMRTQNDMADHKVIIVIMTDGCDTSSCRYNAKSMRELIQNKKDQRWEFLFFGANIDAAQEAETSGIGADSSWQFRTDSDADVEEAFNTMSTVVSNSIIDSYPVDRSAVNPTGSSTVNRRSIFAVNPTGSSTVNPTGSSTVNHTSIFEVNPPSVDFDATNHSGIAPVRAYPHALGRSWFARPFTDDGDDDDSDDDSDDDIFLVTAPDTK